MKDFLNSIPDKVKAFYLLWFIIHFFLWVSNGAHWFPTQNYRELEPLWPSNYGIYRGIDSYDLSDFLFYIIVPIILFYIYTLLKKKIIK